MKKLFSQSKQTLNFFHFRLKVWNQVCTTRISKLYINYTKFTSNIVLMEKLFKHNRIRNNIIFNQINLTIFHSKSDIRQKLTKTLLIENQLK